MNSSHHGRHDLFHAPDVVAEVALKKFGVQIVDDPVKISTNTVCT
jgi:hypothetical protein